MVSKFDPNSYVWIEDDEERFLPAKVLRGFNAGEPTTVETEDGEERKLNEGMSHMHISINCNCNLVTSVCVELYTQLCITRLSFMGQ